MKKQPFIIRKLRRNTWYLKISNKRYFEIKYPILGLIIGTNLFWLSLYFSGCIASSESSNNCFYVTGIDTTILTQFNIFTIKSKNSQKQEYLLSKKSVSSYINDSRYKKLEIGSLYCDQLFRQDTIIKATLRGLLSKDSPDILIDNVVFWSKGNIIANVYFSKKILGLYKKR